jgi:hypothetical protein|tara:strand:+ start:28 stop:171 length:144 start_codon:yes stop_codon:yes gene_type:complete
LIEVQIKISGADPEELEEELSLLLRPIIIQIIKELRDQEVTANEKTE